MNRRDLVCNAVFGLAVLLSGIGIGHFVTESRAAGASLPREALITSAARTLGIKRCLPAIAAIGQRSVVGATMQDIMLDWDRESPDTAPFFSFTGLGAGNQRAAVTLVAIPGANAGCSVLVERVSGSASSCAAVAANELPHYPATRLIDGITIYQNPSQTSETYALVNSGSGCVVIRRQTAFKWPPQR